MLDQSLRMQATDEFEGCVDSVTEIWPCRDFFSGVSEAVIRPLSQWQIPTFFPNLDQKIPNQKVIFM